jgi:hypothetical protein
MAQDPPVLDFFPSKFSIIQNYGKDEITEDSGVKTENLHPFQLIRVEEEAITVAPGTINNHYAGPGGIINHTASTSLDYLVLDCNAGSNGVSNAEIKVESSPPDGFSWSENAVPGNFQILLAAFSQSESYQLIRNNLYADIAVAHSNIKQNISIGEYDSDIYYQWRVVEV